MIPLAIAMSWWVGATTFGVADYGTLSFLAGGWILVALALLTTAIAATLGIVLRRPGALVAITVPLVLAGFYQAHHNLPTHVVPIKTVVTVFHANNGGMVQTGLSAYEMDRSLVIFGGFRPAGSTAIPSFANEQFIGQEVSQCVQKHAHAASINLQHETAQQSVTFEMDCQRSLGLEMVEIYIPQSEYWLLQFVEGSILLVAAALFWLLGWWYIRRTRA